MVCPFCAGLGDPILCDLHEAEIAARHNTDLRAQLHRAHEALWDAVDPEPEMLAAPPAVLQRLKAVLSKSTARAEARERVIEAARQLILEWGANFETAPNIAAADRLRDALAALEPPK